MSSGITEIEEENHSAWDDPLPHALSPTRFYLSRPRKRDTKVVVICCHGRDDNIDDMVGVFLPILSIRYRGIDHRIEDEDEESNSESSLSSCKVSIIGIEARDNSWYPESHNATLPQQLKHNAPYQYSSLYKIRQTILFACESTDLQLEEVILVGFSQGANLVNTYLHIGISQLEKKGKSSTIPIPGHILAFAGSLFKVQPTFPNRPYFSKDQISNEEMQTNQQCIALDQPKKVINRLICGTGDRFFSQNEIEEAAGTIANDSAKVKHLIDIQVSVLMEPRAPHTITNRMMAATIEAIDAVLAN